MKTSKSIFKSIATIATNFLLALVLGLGVAQFVDVNPLNFAGVLTAISITVAIAGNVMGYKVNSFAFMALQTEIWVPFIQENLFPDNQFLESATDHSGFIKYLTVHLPQAGSNPAIFKDNVTLPLAINQRTDTDFTYNLHNYKAEVRLITDLEELQISYDKRSSIMKNYFTTMATAMANNALYSWANAGASRIIKTTGAATSNSLAPSATGTRLALTLADIAGLKAILDKDNVPQGGRKLLIPSDIYNYQLLAINNIQQYYAYNITTLQTGKVGSIFGFDVYVRPSVVVYDNSATPVIKPINDDGTVTTPATTDDMAVIAWHPEFVSKAQGGIKVFANQGRAEYFGDIFSAEVNFGSSPLRSNSIGVATLVQAN